MTPSEEYARLSQIKRVLWPDFDRFEFELCEPGVEPSVQEEALRGGGWRLGGHKGLRHWCRNKPHEPPMTRDRAFDAARAAVLADWRTRHPEWMWGKQSDSSVHDMLSVIEGLGLIKFDKQKTQEAIQQEIVEGEAIEALRPTLIVLNGDRGHGALDKNAECVVGRLRVCGFKIVRA